MSVYEKYFDIGFKNTTEQPQRKINDILSDDMILICGDFYGIQKFIFENLSSKNASKVLRAKSAFIQIFTTYLAKYICSKLGLDENSILSSSAGKFEILSSNKSFEILNDIQNKVNTYFIKNFYGLSGVSIISIECKKEHFKDSKAYKDLREKVTKKVEEKKFNKFDLLNNDNFVLDYDKDIDNKSLCKICNIRKITKENCDICNSFKKLGEILVTIDIDELISSEEIGIKFDDFVCDIILDKKIKSYVLKEEKSYSPITFENLAKNSCKDLKTGIKSIAILKADVDNMGRYLKESDITDNFENFDTFSKTLDSFFSLYITNLMKEKYKNTYTVFAGGDDLFLVGAWDEVLALARQINNDFNKFIKNKLSISFGIAIAKPSTPISYLAHYTEELLEDAKGIDDNKDAISLFNETVKWKSYLDTFAKLEEAFQVFEQNDINTAFLYRLLDLVEMAKKVKNEGDIKSTIWKSKLNYSFYRNMDKKYLPVLAILNEQMEKNPSETKMFLSECIYKRRES